MNRMQMNPTQIIAMMFSGLYQRPSDQGPGSKSSPLRKRRKIGRMYATYSPIVATDVTAAYTKNVSLPHAGAARRNASTQISTTACPGTWRALSFDQ